MADSARSPLQRLKILYLYKILTEHTDEDHPMSILDIIAELEQYGISAGRKALYEDIEALKLYGVDIVDTRGRHADYRVVSREFELPELKLLADAVSSSKFLSESKSVELVDKISQLCSAYQARQLRRQVYVSGRAKGLNEQIYLNIDAIHRAISENRQISFRYFSYDINMRKVYRDDRRICTPYTLVMDDEKYYLVGYYEKRQAVTNFRVDRMENVTVEKTRAVPHEDDFDLADYVSSSFSMFAGKTTTVKLRMDNDLVNVVLDRFGKDTRLIPDGDRHFTLRVKVKPEAPFFGWLFQFGGRITILSPDSVIEKYRSMIDKAVRAHDSTYT